MTNQRPKLPLGVFKYIYKRVPRLCVDVIIRRAGGVLLSRRDIMPRLGMWHLPGGGIRKHERVNRAAQRICREELGLGVAVGKVLGVIEYVREFRGRGFVAHNVSLVVSARPVSGTLGGSWQARETSFFKSLPRGTLPEVRKFLLAHGLIRR